MNRYLDFNATTRPTDSVLAAMAATREFAWANPASIHEHGRRARQVLESAREAVGRALGVHPRDVLFTGSATEANHLALSGATAVITSWLEHPSVSKMAEEYRARGRPVRFASVEGRGTIDLDSVRAAFEELKGAGLLGERPLLALMAVSHETGVLQPLQEARALADEFGAELHVDAVQLVGRGPLPALDCADSLSLAAHKIRGPKGIGVFTFRCGRAPVPVGRGGSQERGLRPGTQDASLAAGLQQALSELDALREGLSEARAARDLLEETVRDLGGTIHGFGSDRLGHVSNFRLPGWQGDEIVAALDLRGWSVSSGSACSAGTAEPSAAIEAMLGREAARGAVRVSFGPGTPLSDAEQLTIELRRLARAGSEVT